MMFWYGNNMGGWGYALMTVSMVLFWALLIAGAIALARNLGRPSQHVGVPPNHRLTPEQLLAERFARGEIDEDEYQQRVKTLRANTTPTEKT